jgi:predicted transcriptional regulator
MPIDLKEIKVIRKKLGMTQAQLAQMSGVSQSLIAKIESDLIDPTYSKTMKIIDTLRHLQGKKELKAKDIMQKKIISVEPSQNVKDVITIMRKHAISQMPVITDHKVVGLISESIILDAMMEGKSNQVSAIMSDAPPVMSQNTSIEVLTDLLKYFPITIIADKGKIEGVVTKSDILKSY